MVIERIRHLTQLLKTQLLAKTHSKNLSTNAIYKIDGTQKRKIKMFGKTTLAAVLEALAAKSKKNGSPVLLIPFSCNEMPGQANDIISIDDQAGLTSLSAIIKEHAGVKNE